MEDIKQRQIEQLQRDIRILEEILSGKTENYTRHPIPVLKRRFIEVPIRFGEVTRKRWARGGFIGGVLHERMRVHEKQDFQDN